MQRVEITTFLEEIHKRSLFDASNLFLRNVHKSIFTECTNEIIFSFHLNKVHFFNFWRKNFFSYITKVYSIERKLKIYVQLTKQDLNH